MILTKPPPTTAITFLLLLLDSCVCDETVSMFNNSEVLDEVKGVCWNQTVRVNEFLGVLEQGFVVMIHEGGATQSQTSTNTGSAGRRLSDLQSSW